MAIYVLAAILLTTLAVQHRKNRARHTILAGISATIAAIIALASS